MTFNASALTAATCGDVKTGAAWAPVALSGAGDGTPFRFAKQRLGLTPSTEILKTPHWGVFLTDFLIIKTVPGAS